MVLDVKLLRYGFNCSLLLNLNFEIKPAHQLVMKMNLNVDFSKSVSFNIHKIQRTNHLKLAT